MKDTVEYAVHFRTVGAGRRKLTKTTPKAAPKEKIPRIARLMALAIHFDRLIREGKVRDQAELAELGGVTRARVTQIMNLLMLAPDIQERLLLGRTIRIGSRQTAERMFRQTIAIYDWHQQRRTLFD